MMSPVRRHRLVPYSNLFEKSWLDVCRYAAATSFSWEAPYLSRPDFDSRCDWCLFQDDELLGCLAGREDDKQNGCWNIEVLAIHPSQQRKGHAARLLALAREQTSPFTEFRFWTSDPMAKNFYEHLAMTQSRFCRRGREQKNTSIRWTIKTCLQPQANLWEYTMARDLKLDL